MLQFEHKLWDKGVDRLAGVDEAGRGPLAGPVVSATVVFDRVFVIEEERGILSGITDSKKLSESRREFFYAILKKSPYVKIGVGMADVDEIDNINILRATHLAMSRAIAKLPFVPNHILVDGLAVKNLPCPSTAIIKGDSKSLSIAAASIVAKVVRDDNMRKLDLLYPEYGFAKHKGYGTKSHIQALFEYGPSPIHRRTFRPVREAEKIHVRFKDEDKNEQ